MAAKSEWRPGPTVCRCCLTEGCYKDISTEYFWMGKREVYAEMLKDTLEVTIAYSKAGGPNSNSRLICESCISRLRDATEFKRQVVECERMFMQHLDPGSSSAAIEAETEPVGKIKVEGVKLEKSNSDDDFDNRHAFGDDDDDDDDDLDNQPLTKLASKMPTKESVDLLDLLDNSKTAEKRKSSTKVKPPPPKKAKSKVEQVKVKPSGSKLTPKPEKKKKGLPGQMNEKLLNIIEEENVIQEVPPKRRYQRSARAEARIIIKKNTTSILECWTLTPFRWKKNKFTCAYCEATFTDCDMLRNHVLICYNEHTVKDIYSKFKEMPLINVDVTQAHCRICNSAFTDVNSMRNHVVQHGFYFDNKQPDGVLPFSLDKELWRCIICHEKFNNFLKLYEHMNSHYQHYICATCGKGYMTAPRLRKHSEVHITGKFPCNKCAKVFTVRVARDYHKAHAHAKGPRYGCPHCSMRFDAYYDRMKHLKEAHREKEVSYECMHCDMSFKTSGKRAIHVRSVHFPPQREFPCPYCEWKFKTKYELKNHIIRHTGERKFKCEACGKGFSRNKTLACHMKTHEEFYFPCKWCSSVFKQKPQLLAHISTDHHIIDLVSQ
ncbi:zinc finger protein 69 homolog B isoform X7 [Amyelois transitella]|uniref:zinc finger protein 69 homolog B isoform X7 n=1 Tax=Amyelois transitella TaxID=680683 RepID=UPI00299075C5|nr:zinc finger protein 69 homolog B isoform X7 [Amyelois transitella]